MKPCKHLDYDEAKYDTCKLVTHPLEPRLRYWERSIYPPGAARDVQFCKLRGRINYILPCYIGEMGCYEPEK